jgi:cyclopropane fatty-acyl-phospholipid synthase-like methyltransferase
MKMNPDARNKEFAAVLEQAKLTDGMVICDMPSGGGYLQDKLPANLNIHLISIESSRQFSRNLTDGNRSEFHLCPLDATPLDEASVDRVVSIAGLHHLENRLDVFLEMKRILRQGGACAFWRFPRGLLLLLS